MKEINQKYCEDCDCFVEVVVSDGKLYCKFCDNPIKFYMYRHGDLLLKKINELPNGLKKLDTKTLAEGEVTGHHHTFSNGMVQIFQEPETKQKYVQVEREAELTHQEHNAIKVKEGLYILIQEREYNPFEAEIRQVMD